MTTIEMSDSGEQILLRLSGEVDVNDAYTIPETVYGVLERRTRRPVTVVLDLSEVTFMDSVGLSMIIRADRETREQGASFTLRNPRGFVARLLAVTALNNHFVIE